MKLILGVLLLVYGVSGKRIVEVQTLTSSEAFSGTNDYIGVGFFAAEFADHCRIQVLDSPGDDFEPGHTDVFTGINLGDCEVYDFQGEVEFASINHSGGDPWTFEWIRVFFDDDSLVTCTNHSPTQVDHDAAVDVPCS